MITLKTIYPLIYIYPHKISVQFIIRLLSFKVKGKVTDIHTGYKMNFYKGNKHTWISNLRYVNRTSALRSLSSRSQTKHHKIL